MSAVFSFHNIVQFQVNVTDVPYRHVLANDFEEQANVYFDICYYQKHNVTINMIHDVMFHRRNGV